MSVSIGLSAVLLIIGISIAIFTPQTALAGGGVGSGGSGGGGSSGGPWGWTTYGHGWATYSSSGSGPTDGFNTGSWATAKSTCLNFSASVAVYILGTGKAPGTSGYPSATGNYMAYDDSGFSGMWGAGGSVDHGRATKISRATAIAAFGQLPTYGVSTAGYTFGNNVGWFCYGIYPTKVTPIVTPAAASVVRGNPATFTLKRTVVDYTGPAKSAKYSITYRFNNAGAWLSIPTAVSAVYDNTIAVPLTLTISADLNAAAIVPNLTFTAANIPAGANSVCVQMQFVAPVPSHVSYTGNPDNACIAIANPPAPPSLSVSAVGDIHEKGDPADKHITYALNVAASACVGNKTIIWGGDGGAPDTTTVIPCGTAASYAGSQATVPAATLDTQPPGSYGAYFGRVRSIDGVASAIVSPTSASIGVYEVPYARFSGNDIYACGGSGVAAIDGRIIFNVGGAGQGAAVQYAALALSGFNAAAPDINTALKGSLASGTNSPCGTDPSGYYPSTVTGPANANIPNAAGYYTTPGSITLNNGTNIGAKVTIHAGGNITIMGNNLGTASAPVLASPFVDNNSVPYVLIIADGDILIDPSVTTINAVLVAGGTISTCSVGNLANPSSANLDTSCRSTLTINGAMSAKNILYRRSIGTRLLNNAPAEVVNFPPYLHFATPFLDDTSSAGYQSLFNAAPYL